MPVVGKPNHAQAVTKSDTANLRQGATYLSFADSTGGPSMTAVVVDMIGGETQVTLSLSAGRYALGVTKVWSTGTTATNIVAYWDS
jgi:hypothetical protein